MEYSLKTNIMKYKKFLKICESTWSSTDKYTTYVKGILYNAAVPVWGHKTLADGDIDVYIPISWLKEKGYLKNDGTINKKFVTMLNKDKGFVLDLDHINFVAFEGK